MTKPSRDLPNGWLACGVQLEERARMLEKAAMATGDMEDSHAPEV
jgi:hypothetical protein